MLDIIYVHVVNLHYDCECMLHVFSCMAACLSGCMHNNYYRGGIINGPGSYNNYYHVGV